jgi:hypothetical protein
MWKGFGAGIDKRLASSESIDSFPLSEARLILA